MALLLQVVLFLCVGWCSSAPLQPPADSKTPNVTSPFASASISDSHMRHQRSIPIQYDDSVALSPYYADLEGRPAPRPPTLTNELKSPLPPCNDKETKCDLLARYRTITARCNNLQNPHHGTPGQAMISILPQSYDYPAVFRMRSVRGGLLPNPRHVSLLLQHSQRHEKMSANSVFVQMGQFIDHDFSITTEASSPQGTVLDCAPCSSWQNPACAPIPVPINDPYQSIYMHGTKQPRCLPFTRSVGYTTKDAQGRLSIHQVNLNTAFLDMSPIYGNEPCTTEKLRRYSCGKLKTSSNHMLMKLPAKEFPLCFSSDGHCYFSGDKRANENIGLTVMHIVFHRVHNQLVEGLLAVNPHWDDERLFQEARRINIAQFQNLVYSEYVPTLLGYHTAAKLQLIPHHEGYFLDYDPAVIPGVFNEFSTAAFRMGHSQVQSYISLMNEKYELVYKLPLQYAFFNSSLMYSVGVYDKLLRGLMGVALKPTDLNLVDGLSNKLFMKDDSPHSGNDLFSLNIARGRDHGLAPYVQYLAACGIKEVKSFADLESLMPAEIVALLTKAYADVRDIDLFPGGLAEEPLPGSLLGPTFNCIIAKQFLTIKLGDRFWFEGPATGFTHEQLQSIRQVSLASVLCNVMDHDDPHVPVRAFHIPDPQSNPLRRCSEITKVNLELWREVPDEPPTPCIHKGQNYQVGRVVPVSPCLTCVCQPGGTVRCQCDVSTCAQAPQDKHCRRICGHSGPVL